MEEEKDGAAASVSQPYLPWNVITPAKYARPSVPASTQADRSQDGSLSLINDKAAHKASEIPLTPHLSVFSALPAHANKTNIRALAQSKRYTAAHSKAPNSKQNVRDVVQPVGDVNIGPATDSREHQTVVEDQDLDAAGILVEVAEKQRPPPQASVVTDVGRTPIGTTSELEASASADFLHKGPVITCEYHHKSSLKAVMDRHTMRHFKGIIACGYELCDFLSDFRNVQTLRSHIQHSHVLNDWFKCNLCFWDLSKKNYLEHLGDCILRTVELQNPAKAEGDAALFRNSHRKDSPGASRSSLSVTAFDPFSGYSEYCSTGMISPPPDIFSAAYDPFSNLPEDWNPLPTLEPPRFIFQLAPAQR